MFGTLTFGFFFIKLCFQVLPMSDLNNTLCRCIGDTFSSSFYVPPNVINFLTVWGKFDASTASVYGTLIGVFLIYLVLVILLRKQDRKDSEKVMYVKHFDLKIVSLAFFKKKWHFLVMQKRAIKIMQSTNKYVFLFTLYTFKVSYFRTDRC